MAALSLVRHSLCQCVCMHAWVRMCVCPPVPHAHAHVWTPARVGVRTRAWIHGYIRRGVLRRGVSDGRAETGVHYHAATGPVKG